jgi:hypothetical protein
LRPLSRLLLSAASLSAIVVAVPAIAKPTHSRPSSTSQAAELKALREQIQILTARLDAQEAATLQTQSATRDVQAQTAAVTAQAAEMHAVSVTPSVTEAQVSSQIASAISKEHANDKFYFKGITITPGGFLELAGIYRQHFMGNDISTGFNTIPFPSSHQGYTNEGRLSARQSRLSFLAQGQVNKQVTLGMYGEFDFQGAAQTANSNESNSYNPRIRQLYGTIDWDRGNSGIHLLAGQNWSLVTMNTKGITPRNELTPPQIDAQYVPGFAWTRTPQIRVAADFLDHKLWLAVSAENPATTSNGTVPAFITNTSPSGSGFDSANTLSLNHVPDVVGKVAYEANLGGHGLHIEAFGVYRNFSAHVNGANNINKSGGGFGGGIVFQAIPKVLDLQASVMTGRGIGRYGSSQLPDVTFGADGTIHPIRETMILVGATLHATKRIDLYGFAGEERDQRESLGNVGATLYGYGNPLLNNSGCLIEGGTCSGVSKDVRQLTFGIWDKFYQGAFGRAQVGVQYSYTDRELFSAVGGAPRANQSMGFVSFRYYPF